MADSLGRLESEAAPHLISVRGRLPHLARRHEMVWNGICRCMFRTCLQATGYKMLRPSRSAYLLPLPRSLSCQPLWSSFLFLFLPSFHGSRHCGYIPFLLARTPIYFVLFFSLGYRPAMDPYSQNSKRKMSYRKPAPIYVPTPPSSPPQAIRESVRYSFAEAALGMNMSSSVSITPIQKVVVFTCLIQRPHDWRFTTASVASQSTVSFPSSDDDGESTYDIPFAPELATREVRKTLVRNHFV